MFLLSFPPTADILVLLEQTKLIDFLILCLKKRMKAPQRMIVLRGKRWESVMWELVLPNLRIPRFRLVIL